MGSSVPGNSCGTSSRCCAPVANSGCIVRVQGTCVFYSGSNITSANIYTGDTFNSTINNIYSYINEVIPPSVTASNGLSVSSDIVLGQDIGEAGSPAVLTSHREIPTNGFNLCMSGTGNLIVGGTIDNTDKLQVGGTASILSGSVRFTGEGFGGAPVMRTTSFLSLFNTSNLVIEQGVGTTATSYPEFRLTGVNATTALNFCGVINGLNFAAGTLVKQALLITTSGVASSTNQTCGDIIIRPGSRVAVGNPSTQDGNNSVLLQPSGTGDVTITNVSGNARLGVGQVPTAKVHIAAGTATAGTSPLKFTAGVNLSVLEDGAMEFDGANLYITIAGVRRTINVT
jgi:hypothetical protein